MKMMESYAALADIYDDINKEVDYPAFADFYEKCFNKYMNTRPELVLDLACGTGKMTEELDRRGYDMTGIDLSYDMLMIAKDRAYELERNEQILYLCQNMTAFELYGTVDACVCTLDGLNYLTFDSELLQTFENVHTYLIPDGLFVFDMSTKYKFENIYASNSYLYEGSADVGDYFCAWQNMYDRESGVCEFALSTFIKNRNGSYRRADEVQYQRMYETDAVRSLLEKCGFEVLDVTGDLDFSPLKDNDERMFFVARCKK
jgi:SAM-dependent methyltransferase